MCDVVWRTMGVAEGDVDVVGGRGLGEERPL